MYSLVQSRRIRGAAGEPLPTVWPSLERNDTRFRRGQLVLIAAGPGAGKSLFALNYAIKSQVAGLYISADSDAYTQWTRAAAIALGCTLDQADQADKQGTAERADRALAEVPLWLTYSASPTLDEIQSTVWAYEELYGEYPELIVIDNITNVRSPMSEDSDPFSGLEGLMDYLHTLARETQACVLGLHHVTGAYNDSDKAIPLSGVKGQITRVPEQVLTLHKQVDEEGFDTDTLLVSTVKNRAGKADQSGRHPVALDFRGAHASITEPGA